MKLKIPNKKKNGQTKVFFEMISQLDVPGHEGSEVGRASFGRKRNSPKWTLVW